MKYFVFALALFSAACQSQNVQPQPQRQIGERRGAANSDWVVVIPPWRGPISGPVIWEQDAVHLQIEPNLTPAPRGHHYQKRFDDDCRCYRIFLVKDDD